MVWLPVVERELRVAARKPATYRVRVLALLAVMVVLGWAVFTASQLRGLSVADAGRQLFISLVEPAAFFSILIGVFATSDCIGVEKREGTLGLLFLTDLKGYDVVFGKLVASSLNGFYALIAVLPVLGVPLLIGGVTFRQFLAVAAALVTAIVFSLSVGILVSTYQQSERKAMFMTLVFLLVVAFGPAVVENIPGMEFLLLVSPVYHVSMATTNSALPPVYWRSMAVIWLMTILLLVRASKRAPVSWQDKEAPAATSPFFRHLASRPNRQLLNDNPFAWLAARGEGDPRLVWLFLASMVGIWLLMLLIKPGGLKPRDLFSNEFVKGSDMVINIVLKIWIVSEASRRFAEDRHSGAFELLLSTPLTVKQIVNGQWLALWRQFGAPFLAVLAWDAFLGAGMARAEPDANSYEHLLAAFFLGADAIALSLVGMWLGLLTQSRNRAILGGLVLVLTLPWLVAYAVNSSLDWSGLTVQWVDFAIWGLADQVVIVWAASSISEHFRRVATEGLSAKLRAD
jgi:ABC-type transport system involved in multi-copper enzyme maturation permease subunit